LIDVSEKKTKIQFPQTKKSNRLVNDFYISIDVSLMRHTRHGMM